MWHANSGGSSKLNTTTKVTPHAFAQGVAHRSVYDMTAKYFLHNTSMHLGGGSQAPSEFSSWSASIHFALSHAVTARKRPNVHVAILDTEEMAKPITAFHVPALGKIFGAGFNYPEEYLVHGVIEGDFYKAVSLQELCKRGLLDHFPELPSAWGTRTIPGTARSYNIKELHELGEIAALYGSRFRTAFGVALFCCKKHKSAWSGLSQNDLNKIIKALGGRDGIPADWAGSRSVFGDGVYPKGWEDNEQMRNLVLALHTHCWGKGARNKARYAIRDHDNDIDSTGGMASLDVGDKKPAEPDQGKGKGTVPGGWHSDPDSGYDSR